MPTRKFLQKKNTRSARNTRNSMNEQPKFLQQEVNNLNIKLGQQKQKTIAIEGQLHRMLDKLKPLHEMHKVLSESLQPLEKTAEVRGNIQHIMDLLHEVEGEVAAAGEVGC
jgi:archaellum component FlaC